MMECHLPEPQSQFQIVEHTADADLVGIDAGDHIILGHRPLRSCGLGEISSRQYFQSNMQP